MEKNFNNVETENTVQEVHKYLDCDFYRIELDEDCNIIIHPVGFIYDAQDSIYEDEPERTYRLDWYYDDFIVQVAELQDKNFDYNETCCENICFDYTEDITEKEAYELLDSGLGMTDEEVVELPLNEISKHTPCGWYVNYPKSFMN